MGVCVCMNVCMSGKVVIMSDMMYLRVSVRLCRSGRVYKRGR